MKYVVLAQAGAAASLSGVAVAQGHPIIGATLFIGALVAAIREVIKN